MRLALVVASLLYLHLVERGPCAIQTCDGDNQWCGGVVYAVCGVLHRRPATTVYQLIQLPSCLSTPPTKTKHHTPAPQKNKSNSHPFCCFNRNRTTATTTPPPPPKNFEVRGHRAGEHGHHRGGADGQPEAHRAQRAARLQVGGWGVSALPVLVFFIMDTCLSWFF